MTMASFHAVDWALLDHTASEPVKVGDMVSAEPGGMPIYRVLAFAQGLARLESERAAATREMSLDGFRWRGTAG
jgi:hypothetical protein